MDSLRNQNSESLTVLPADVNIKKHFLQAMAPEAIPHLTRILISGIRITNVADPVLQEALLEIDPNFNLLHIINNSLQEAPFHILLTAATFTDPSLIQPFLDKCLHRAKAEDGDDHDRIHFYLDPCGLTGSLNHIPSYISFKIDACSRATNGGGFEPFLSKVRLPLTANPNLFSDWVFACKRRSPFRNIQAVLCIFALKMMFSSFRISFSYQSCFQISLFSYQSYFQIFFSSF
jgi:hypothetical protein